MSGNARKHLGSKDASGMQGHIWIARSYLRCEDASKRKKIEKTKKKRENASWMSHLRCEDALKGKKGEEKRKE